MATVRVSGRAVIEVDETELQMLAEAMRRAEPYKDLSDGLNKKQAALTRKLHEAVNKLPGSS